MRELIPDAGLVADELLSNALVHARAERAQLSGCRLGFTIRRVRQGVVIEVHDHGAPRPLTAACATGPVDSLRESGRGLFLVNALTDGAWGVAPRPDSPGKVVWALLPGPARAEA